jgi:serine/threonine protein kinase
MKTLKPSGVFAQQERAAVATDPWIGRQLGAYQILDLVGRGGMGSVYRALHSALERYAAIKFLRADRAGDPALDERFVREARAIARLRHPHVVQLYDFGAYDDGYYMILEFVEGENLYERLKALHRAGERLPQAQVWRIVDQLADALTHVHRQGIVHRDVKPANVLLNDDGDVILSDFGVARLLVREGEPSAGTLVGTPAYIAPEQAQGLPADHRADRYAMAVVLYEMLAARPPFVAGSATDLLAQHVHAPPPPLAQFAPHVSPDVERVLFKALSKSSQDRHQSVASFRDALQRAWEAGVCPVGPGDGAPLSPLLAETPLSTGNLPFLRASLVGRRAEIEDLKSRLARAPALVSLVGMGGVGKTVLALAVAHELAAGGAFVDGFFWIDGREHTTLGAIVAQLAALLGLDLGREALSQQRRAVTFHLAGRDAMVILDNLETVEDAQAAIEFLGELSCAVLVTCRVRPAGGEVIELAPLSSEAALRLFQSVSALETQELDQAASDLCALDLEGHPLAIEVVGALVAAGLDAAEVRGYLQEMPLDVLSETASGAGRSVVDTLQLSYQRLSPLAQTLLARMSIFPAGFDLAALAALSPEHSRLHQVKGLRQLLERSLLVQVSRQHYRLHPVIRQFAYTLLDEPAPFHRRASAHFMTAAGHDSLAATEQLFLAGDVGQGRGPGPGSRGGVDQRRAGQPGLAPVGALC